MSSNEMTQMPSVETDRHTRPNNNETQETTFLTFLMGDGSRVEQNAGVNSSRKSGLFPAFSSRASSVSSCLSAPVPPFCLVPHTQHSMHGDAHLNVDLELESQQSFKLFGSELIQQIRVH